MTSDSSPQTTILLRRWASGEQSAASELMPRVYAELKQIADQHLRHAPGEDVLQATGLVHEAFLKLIDQHSARYEDRAHFLAIASTLMRRIVIDETRRRLANKRGGGQKPLHMDTFSELNRGPDHVDLIAFDEVLTRLESLNDRHARVIEMRFFGGLTVRETAEALDVSEATVKNDWRVARAWLAVELRG